MIRERCPTAAVEVVDTESLGKRASAEGAHEEDSSSVNTEGAEVTESKEFAEPEIGVGQEQQARVESDQASSQSTRVQQSVFTQSPTGGKLHRVAAEFEAQLLSSLWKSMKTSFAADDDDSNDPVTQSFQDLGHRRQV